ncbi:MAG: sigma-70 family RNA polymerase sigma factor [Polyangiaceae bacterium]|nr:sigma-70 family RNA polymerase sigma factor [Polyangiaceae bacterium]
MEKNSRDLSAARIFGAANAVEPENTDEIKWPPNAPDKWVRSVPGRRGNHHPSLYLPEPQARDLNSLRPVIERILRRHRVTPRHIPDLIQEILAELIRVARSRGHSSQPPINSTAYGFVAVVARRVARNRSVLKALGEREDLGELWDLLDCEESPHSTTTSTTPLDLIIEKEEEQKLTDRLDWLSQATKSRYWRAFYAFTILAVPIEDIAESENVSPASIYDRVRRAREDIKAALQRDRASRAPKMDLKPSQT